jgi:hypothetical protein
MAKRAAVGPQRPPTEEADSTEAPLPEQEALTGFHWAVQASEERRRGAVAAQLACFAAERALTAIGLANQYSIETILDRHGGDPGPLVLAGVEASLHLEGLHQQLLSAARDLTRQAGELVQHRRDEFHAQVQQRLARTE